MSVADRLPASRGLDSVKFKMGAAESFLKWAIWTSLISAVWWGVVGTSTIAFVGTFNFTTAELTMVIAGIALVLGGQRYGMRLGIFSVAAATFAALTAANLLRGLNADSANAFVAARSTLPFAIMLMLGSIRFPAAIFRCHFEKAVTTASVVLAVVVFARLLLGPQFLMLGGSSLNAAEINDGGRTLSAQAAMVLAVAGVVQLSSALRGQGISRNPALMAALFFFAVILTGQGTASIAAISGMIVVATLERGPATGLRLLIGGAIAVVVLSGIATIQNFHAADWSGVLPSSMLENLERRTANLGTREMVWRSAWSAYEHGALLNQIIGWPTGSTPQLIVVSRSWGHVTWSNSVHSMYFGVLLNQGAMGLVAFLGTLLAAATLAFRSTLRSKGAVDLAFVLMIVIFSYSYSLSIEQALVLAVAAMPFTRTMPAGVSVARRARDLTLRISSTRR